jgi:hypothetical protein
MLGEEGVSPRSWLPVSLSDQLDFHNLGVCEIQSGTKLGTIYYCECGKVQNADLWLHIAIDMLASRSQ